MESDGSKDKAFLEHLKTLSPVILDKEIIDINYVETEVPKGNSKALPVQIKDLKAFLLFLKRQIKSKTDFEFIQVNYFN